MRLIILWTKTERGKKMQQNACHKVIHGPKNNGQKSFGPNVYWTK